MQNKNKQELSLPLDDLVDQACVATPFEQTR